MSDQPSWPSSDEGSQPPPPPSEGNAPPPPPPPASNAPPPQQQSWGDGGVQPSGQPTAATYGVRFGARFIDGLILLIPNFVVGAIIGGGGLLNTGFTIRGWIATVVTTLIGFGYYVYLESNRGQTFGKQLLNLRVYGAAGGNPTQDEAMKRNAFLLLGIIPTALGGLLGFAAQIAIPITGSSDPYKRGWHDNFAGGTTVVRT